MAKYDDQVEKQRQIDINGWWFGGKRLETYYEDVVRSVDLRFDLQAKILPTVYGVRRVKGNTVFADIGSTSKTTSDETTTARWRLFSSTRKQQQ